MMDQSREKVRLQAEEYLSSCTEYADPYEHEKLVRDWEKKGDVAKNVIGDFTARAGTPAGKSVLDIGFGNGLYALAFAEAGAVVSGIEVNPVLLRIAEDNSRQRNLHVDLSLYGGATFPFADSSFDYAFSVSVLEHVDDPGQLLREASRVLKPGGKFYLAFPNRISFKETHTGIYFLNYVPRSVAQFLLRKLWRRNTIEEINLHFMSYWKMKRLARRAGFHILYEQGGKSPLRSMLKRALRALGMHHSAILRTVMVVLEKREK